MKTIIAALVNAQKAFAPVIKNKENTHFKNKFADLQAVVNAVQKALNDNDIYLLQKNYDHPDGIMIETVFLHTSGEMLECGILFFPTVKKDPQAFKSALTYARRSSLLSACGLAEEDDDGNSARDDGLDSNTMVDHILAIQDAADHDALKKAYLDALKACGNDSKWKTKIIDLKDKRKGELQ
jgi:hypothetical protein